VKILVTGIAGHLGEAMVQTLRSLGHDIVGLDLITSPFTTHRGSILGRSLVKSCMQGVERVFHAATLHKPHLATHSRQDFVNTNISGTLTLLEEAVAAGIQSFVYTSPASVFGEINFTYMHSTLQ
jgi:nucleoside-diphosphate-sugar epimerase